MSTFAKVSAVDEANRRYKLVFGGGGDVADVRSLAVSQLDSLSNIDSTTITSREWWKPADDTFVDGGDVATGKPDDVYRAVADVPLSNIEPDADTVVALRTAPAMTTASAYIGMQKTRWRAVDGFRGQHDIRQGYQRATVDSEDMRMWPMDSDMLYDPEKHRVDIGYDAARDDPTAAEARAEMEDKALRWEAYLEYEGNGLILPYEDEVRKQHVQAAITASMRPAH